MNNTEHALNAAEKEMQNGKIEYLPVPPLELLRERVISAIEHVPFYQALYEPLGSVPGKDSDFIEWFTHLPIVNKSQLQAAGLAMLLNPNYNQSELIRKPTSGSTGVPFTLLLHSTVINFRKWRFLRPYQLLVKEPPTRLVFIFPWHFLERTSREEKTTADKTKSLPIENEGIISNEQSTSSDQAEEVSSRFNSLPKKNKRTKKDALEKDQSIEGNPILNRPFTVNSWLPTEQLFEVLHELNPATLIGFASSLAALARWMIQKKQRLQSIKQIWTTSEVLSPEGADMIRKAMRCEPLTIYASNEFGFMAWEAEKGGPMYFESDHLYLENIQFDKPLPAKIGDVSRIVVTDLLNDTMPLIRYDIEDVAQVCDPIEVTQDLQCKVIQNLQGKQSDQIQPPDGRTVTTFQILGAIKDNLPNAQYRFIAVAHDRYILQYRPGVGFSYDYVDVVIRALRDIIGSEVEIIPHQVESIEREPSGKLRPIINLSNVSERNLSHLVKQLGILSLIPSFTSRDEAISIVQKALAAVLSDYKADSKFDEEQELYSDLAIDSLHFVRIVLELERELGKEINDEDLLDTDLISVGDLVTFVEKIVLR